MVEKHERLSQILSEALEQPSREARERYLNETCGQDQELREQVNNLIKGHAEAGDFLRHAVIIADGKCASAKEGLGTVIGRYKLLQEIGEGGFGLVYMAEQREPVRRMVALKILKAGMDSKEVIARFEAERQALALMDHPNIARVLDGGTTASGRPYFVMDLVKGVPITEFCDQNQLSTEARLRLFVQVCAGVQHAHQKGIIHRDLKPTNVLVSVEHGEPVPKVIDFGIAKALGQKLTERTLFTRFEQLIGTPAYMSPEQAEWGGIDIDTRSDIYSLGAMLYELLTGTTPFEKETLARAALDEVRRMIRETEPPTPSLRLQGLGQRLGEVAQRRQAEGALLTRRVRGDLDWIVMKALDKDRARRYETANGLAMDLQRHLDNEPVVACPPSLLYEFQKSVRRHKVGFAAAGAVMVALALGLALALVGFTQAMRANRKAQDDRAEAQSINQLLLEDFLEQANPYHNTNRNITLRELIDRASAKLTQRFTTQPVLEAQIRQTLAETYRALGESQKAESNQVRAAELYTRVLGPDDPKTIKCIAELGGNRYGPAASAEGAERLLKQELQASQRVSGPEATNTLTILQYLGGFYASQSRLQEAVPLLGDLLEKEKRVLGSDNGLTLATMEQIAAIHNGLNEHAEAAVLVEEAVRLGRKSLGSTNYGMLNHLAFAAHIRFEEGEYRRAAELYRETLRLRRTIFDPQQWGIKNDKMQLATIDGILGDWSECLEIYLELSKFAKPGDLDDLMGIAERGAAAALLAGDTNAYREFARQWILSVTGMTNRVNAWLGCEVCLLRPVGSSELEPVLKLAELIKPDHKDFAKDKLAKGLAAYRKGDMGEALILLDGWRRYGFSSTAALAGYFSAMAHHRRGDLVAARADLDEAGRRLAMFVNAGMHQDQWWDYGWFHYGRIASVRAEAESLVLGSQVTPSLNSGWLASAQSQWLSVLHQLESADHYVSQRRWSRARDEIVAATRQQAFSWEGILEISDRNAVTEIGVALLLAKDLPEFERFQRNLFAHLEQYSFSDWIWRALKAPLVCAPDAKNELCKEALGLCRRLETAHYKVDPEGLGMVRAVAAYREGRNKEVLEQSKVAEKAALGTRGVARIFRAMALGKLGRWEEGKKELLDVEKDLGDHVQTLNGETWWDLGLCQIALEEAHQLFGLGQGNIAKGH